MEELLKNIMLIREEIDKLSVLSNEKSLEYCEIGIKIADNEEEFKQISLTKDELEEKIMDFKFKKGMLFSCIAGILMSSLFFACLIISKGRNLTVGTVLFTALGAPTFSVAFAGMIDAFLSHFKKFDKFLMKRYTNFKNLNEELNNLQIKSKTIENELKEMTSKKEEIVSIITNNEEILDNKKGELYKLEEEYFNNIVNGNITNGTNYNVTSTGKKRTRTIGNSHYER